MEDKRKTSLADAINAFMNWRQARGFADSTRTRDQVTLLSFARTTGNIRASSLTTSHLDDFFTSRSMLSPQTQNLDLSTIRIFFTFLETRGYHPRATNLLADYKKLKYAPPPRRRVPVGEFPALLDAAERPRDRCLLALGLYLFLRASEIKLLKIKHVSLSTDEVSTVIPKTRDTDVMPVSSELEAELRRWLRAYAEQAGSLDPEWFLIPNVMPCEYERGEHGRILAVTGERLITDQPLGTPQKIVQRALAEHGWTDTFREGVHTLRRSGARALYDELAASDGHSNALETVSAMLHHKNMATTQHYLGLTETRRKRDRLIAGKPMFPSLLDPKVVPLRQDEAHG